MLTNATDKCAVAMYSRIRCKNRLHGHELTLIPFLFFVVGFCVETATVFFFKSECYCCNELDRCKEAMISDVVVQDLPEGTTI